MTIQAKIERDYLAAFKAHDQVKVDVLRLMKAAMKNAEIELRKTTLDDSEAITVLTREAKRRKESIGMYQQGNRPELAQTEQAELETIATYLPAQLDEVALAAIVAEAITSLNATPKDFGKVMSAVMAKVKGQADGNRVSAAVKQQLK